MRGGFWLAQRVAVTEVIYVSHTHLHTHMQASSSVVIKEC